MSGGSVLPANKIYNPECFCSGRRVPFVIRGEIDAAAQHIGLLYNFEEVVAVVHGSLR